MELLLFLTYTAICVAIFKLFKISRNKRTVPTAALGGVVLISTLFTVMNYNHPYSESTRMYFASIPVHDGWHLTSASQGVPAQGLG